MQVPQGAADSQTPADGKQFATAEQERAAGQTPRYCTDKLLAGWKFADARAHVHRGMRAFVPVRELRWGCVGQFVSVVFTRMCVLRVCVTGL